VRYSFGIPESEKCLCRSIIGIGKEIIKEEKFCQKLLCLLVDSTLYRFGPQALEYMEPSRKFQEDVKIFGNQIMFVKKPIEHEL